MELFLLRNLAAAWNEILGAKIQITEVEWVKQSTPRPTVSWTADEMSNDNNHHHNNIHSTTTVQYYYYYV
jgi:hypothetical protein